jgi:hypothetical protein
MLAQLLGAHPSARAPIALRSSFSAARTEVFTVSTGCANLVALALVESPPKRTSS